MAVKIPTRRANFGFREANTLDSARHNVKLGFDLSPTGKQALFGSSDDYLSGPLHGLSRVEARDAQVPDCNEPASILDLSTAALDTPSIIDSIVDVLPFRFAPAPDPVPEDMHSQATVNAILCMEDNHETFQDIGRFIVDPPMPMPSVSPAPLLSPTGSVYSDVTVGSPNSLMSAASTSSETRFSFAPDFEVIGASSVKSESGKDNRYVEMRRRNNLASKRSRLTRREKERDMEQQLKKLMDENSHLKTKMQTLEELVEKTKSIILQVISQRKA